MSTVGESVATREDIPLKTGTEKARSWYSCNEDFVSGPKFIYLAFGTLTLVITVALMLQIYYGDYQVVPHGSVATDSFECSKIGTSILKQGGRAIDAAIASAFCMAVAAPHLTSLDASGQILKYNHRYGTLPTVVDFSSPNLDDIQLPKMVLGMAYLHLEYGKIPWKKLVEPAAELAKQGYLVSKMLVQAVNKAKAEDLYGRLEAGQILRHQNLSETLYKIANMSKEELYSYIKVGNIPGQYQAVQSTTFNNYDIYVPNSAVSITGPLLLQNLEGIAKFNFSKSDTEKPEFVYHLAETTQSLYAKMNVSEIMHEGTSTNIAVIDKDDNYISLITGLHDFFGSGVMTAHGYVLDVKTKRRKPYSRLPIILTQSRNKCGRRMVFAANDISVATQIVTSLTLADEDAKESIEAPRYYILGNGTVGIEGFHNPSFTNDTLTYLKSLSEYFVFAPEPYLSVNIVEQDFDDLSSHSDSRGGGIASRF